MKINKLLFIISIIALSSCITNKDVVYLNDLSDKEFINTKYTKAPIYKVKVGDNIFVDIKSPHEEVNNLFNTSTRSIAASQMSNNYGSPVTQYLSGYIVDVRGMITLPMLGDLLVEKLSLNQIKLKIEQKVNSMVKGAIVKVRMLNYKITVLGEVKSPGTYYNYNASINILDAISLANGITDYALIKNVLVVRQTDKGSITYRLDLRDKDFMLSDAYYLNVNDVIYIQPDKWKSVKVNSTFYSLLMSSVSTLVLVLNVLK